MKLKQIHNIFAHVFVLISSLFYFFSSLRRGDQSTVFAQILTDPGLLRSGTRLHWFVAVVLLILEDFSDNNRASAQYFDLCFDEIGLCFEKLICVLVN